MFIAVIVCCFILVLLLIYIGVLRPWQLRWGAADEEVKRTLPGDNLVDLPHFHATRAVTIQAPVLEVWKWLLQIGAGRAGFYSLDWIDNAGKPSAREIIPEYQKIGLDDFVPFTPDQKNGMWVKDFLEFKYILWWDKKGNASWVWFLESLDGQQTRLITRLKTKYDFSFPWIIYYLFYDFGDIIMMRRCLLGIKERAEANIKVQYQLAANQD